MKHLDTKKKWYAANLHEAVQSVRATRKWYEANKKPSEVEQRWQHFSEEMYSDVKKAWMRVNLDKARETRIKWYEANLDNTPTDKHWYEFSDEKYSDTKKHWYEANLETARFTRKKWYEANVHPDPHAELKKRWYQANLSLVRTQNAKQKYFAESAHRARENQKLSLIHI